MWNYSLKKLELKYKKKGRKFFFKKVNIKVQIKTLSFGNLIIYLK